MMLSDWVSLILEEIKIESIRCFFAAYFQSRIYSAVNSVKRFGTISSFLYFCSNFCFLGIVLYDW